MAPTTAAATAASAGDNGWFGALGSSGPMVQTIMTTVFGILAAGIMILCVFMAVKAGVKLMQAETADERKEAKKKLIWIAIGASIGLLATIIPNILWNTIGAYSEATGS